MAGVIAAGGDGIAGAGAGNRRPHRPGRVEGRPPRHGLPQGPTAQRRAGEPHHRGLDPGHPGRPGGGLPQYPAAFGAPHAAARPARLRRAGRPRQRHDRLRWRSPHRLRLHDQLHRWHRRRHHHQREQLQRRLGRQLAPRGSFERRGVDGRGPASLAPRPHARRRRQTHAQHLPGSRGRLHRRTRRLAAGELRASALSLGFRAHRGRELQPVAAGHHAVCLRPLRQHRQEQRR